MLKRIIGVIITVFVFTTAAIADDWVVSKIRGGVFVFKSGEWVQLKRGDVVSDSSAIQTAKKSRATLMRGKETLALSPDTRIRISDKNGSKRTVVEQDFGELTVDVEKRNVQHFEVRAPLLAAVVKGTRFTVSARGAKASIDVERGRVEARDNKAGMKVDVKPSQSVEIDRNDQPVLAVEGRGKKEPIRSTTNGKVLSVKEIVTKAAKAHPTTPLKTEKAQEIAAQQGQKLTKDDVVVIAKAELKAAKKSGNVAAVIKAQASVAAATDAPTPTTSVEEVKAAGKAAEAQAKAEKKAAEIELKEAKKSGNSAAIAAEEKVAEAKQNEKEVKEESKEAEKAAKEAEKAEDEAAKQAEKDLKDLRIRLKKQMQKTPRKPQRKL